METMPLAMMKHLEEDVPPVFMILDTYDKDVKVDNVLNRDVEPLFFCIRFLNTTYFMFSSVSLVNTFLSRLRYLLFICDIFTFKYFCLTSLLRLG